MWIVFGFGVGLAIFGIALLCRQIVWRRLARTCEAIAILLGAVVGRFEIAPNAAVDEYDVRLFDSTANDIKQLATEVGGMTKWLWPHKSGLVTVIAQDLVPPVERIREHIKKRVAKTNEGLKHREFRGTIQWMSRSAELTKDVARSVRDSAGVEVVWAATSFALGSLMVGLFALCSGG